MRILIAFALIACAYGQGNLNSFPRLRDALLEGSELVLNADAADCNVNFDFELLVSMPLRQWQHIIQSNGNAEIRADDFYIDTADADYITWITRTVNIYEDDSVLVTLTVTGQGSNSTSDQLRFECELGQGARAHRIIQGNDLSVIDSYNRLKSVLLLGDHVEAIGYLNQCDNADEVFQNGNQYEVGYQIVRFDVVGDGTDDEFILFDDLAILSADGSQFSIGAEQVILSRDGSAIVTVAVFDGNDLSEITSFSLNCRIGTALRFTVHRRENENTYTTYPEIKEATLSGHDMELVVFLGNCEVLEGEAVNTPGTIVSARADEFQLFKAGSFWGDVEYIAYTSWSLDVSGQLYSDIARVYEDGTLTIEYFIRETGGGSEIASGLLSCPLEDAALFHAVQRTRAPITSYNEIVNGIRNDGRIYEIEIDYDACGIELGSIFGGIAWETYIDPAPNTGFVYADEFTLIKTNITGTPAPAWDVAGIAVLPDDTVVISARLYDWATGENLAPADDPVICQLGNGVVFFRYP